MRIAWTAIGVGIALVTVFLIPVIPLGISHSWAAICPPGTVGLCSIGDGSMLFTGYGSVSYKLLGVGGTWGYPPNHYAILHNGCYISADGKASYCYSSCSLNSKGLCA